MSIDLRRSPVRPEPRALARALGLELFRDDVYRLPPIRWRPEVRRAPAREPARAPLKAAAPTHVRSDKGSDGVSTTSSVSFNATGGDLIVAITANLNTDAATGVTFNGSEAFTEFASGLPGDQQFYDFTGKFQIWYRVAPTQTTANVVATWPSGVEHEMTVHLFNGADQTTPLINLTTLVHLSGTDTNSFSRSPTSTVDHLIVAAMATIRWDLSATSGASQTRLAAGSDGAGGDAGWLRVDSKPGEASSTTVSFTFGSNVAATLYAFGIATSTPSTGPAVVTLTPLDGAQCLVPTDTLSIEFNEDVIAGTGDILLIETGVGTVETIDVTDTGQVSFVDDTVTITLSAPLDRNKAYHVTIDSGAIVSDVDAEIWGGYSSATSWNFDTFVSRYVGAGAIDFSTSGGTSVDPAYPTTETIAAGDLLVLLIGQKPSSANGGTCTTPGSWARGPERTGATDGDTGGYTTTLGADTGNCNLYSFTIEATGGESGTLAVTVGTNGVGWGQILHYKKASDCTWSVAGTTGKDTAGGSVSIAGAADQGVIAWDEIVGAMVIPTDVTTPNQFSAQAFTQTGVTFGTVAEVSEPDSTVGNDIGGFIVRCKATAGPSSAAPTMTATAGGTTTNVRGPGVVLRVRAAVPSGGITSTGALALGEHAVVGAGSESFAGAAALALGEHAVAAAAAVVNPVTSTGALALGEHAVAGVGSESFAGTAALELQEHAIAGSATAGASVTGTGALALGEHAVAATGAESFAGAAALALQEHAIAAAAAESLTGAAALELQEHVVAGSATAGVDATSTAALALGEHAVAAAGAESFAGAAAIELQQHAVAAVGVESFPVAGALELQQHAVAAAGVESFTGAGAAVVGEHAVVGSASAINPATGAAALELQQHAVSGAASERFTGAAALALQQQAVAGAASTSGHVTSVGAAAIGRCTIAAFGIVIVTPIVLPPGAGKRPTARTGNFRPRARTVDNRTYTATANRRPRSLARGREATTRRVTVPVTLSPLGADLLHHWEVWPSSDSRITLNGSNIAMLEDAGVSAKHLTQATPAIQPPFEETGGANGRPCATLPTSFHSLFNETLAIPNGSRPGIYAIFQSPADGVNNAWLLNKAADGVPQARIAYHAGHGGWWINATDEIINVVSPAHTTAFVKGSIEYLSTGRLGQVNDVPTNPGISLAAACDEITIASIGQNGGGSNGKFCCLIVVNDIHVDTAFKRSVVYSYLLARYGL